MDIRESIKGIIFDLDGTLFDLDVDWAGLRLHIEKTIGRKFSSFDELLNSASGPEKNSITRLIEEAEAQGEINGFVIKGVEDVLPTLTGKYKIAVVTRNGRKSAKGVLRKIGLDTVILVSRNEVENLKPNPQALQLALDAMELMPEEIIVVGDTSHDVDAAHNLGSKCIVVKNPKLSYSPPNGDLYIDSLKNLISIL